jgi:hypothetical protein
MKAEYGSRAAHGNRYIINNNLIDIVEITPNLST